MSQAAKGGHKNALDTESIRVPRYGSFVACRGIQANDVAAILAAHAELRGGPRCLKLKGETMVTRVSAGPSWTDLGLTSGPDVVVKQAPIPARRSCFYRLGGTSRFRRDFAIHAALAERAIASPRPYACSLRPRGRFEFAIAEFLSGTTLRELLWLGNPAANTSRTRDPAAPPELRDQVLEALGGWLRRLHERGVWQRDLKAENVMIQVIQVIRSKEGTAPPDFQLHLLDIAAVRFLTGPIERERCVRNLSQLLDLPSALDPVAAGPLLRGYLRGEPATDWEREVKDAVKNRRDRRAQRTGYRYVDDEYFGTVGPETI